MLLRLVQRVERLVAIVITKENEVVEHPRHLMLALAELPVVHDARYDDCSAVFERLASEY